MRANGSGMGSGHRRAPQPSTLPRVEAVSESRESRGSLGLRTLGESRSRPRLDESDRDDAARRRGRHPRRLRPSRTILRERQPEHFAIVVPEQHR